MGISVAVILAAGLGTRLSEITKTKPKAFLEINGETLIKRSLDILRQNGIKKVIIGTGHLSEFFEGLQINGLDIVCKKNDLYESSGSMKTLSTLQSEIKDDDFLLLESDILFENRAIEEILVCEEPDVILASGLTSSDDEVFIQTDAKHRLEKLSKNRNDLDSIYAELVGINKLSNSTFQLLVSYAEKEWNIGNHNLDYEKALEGIAKVNHVFVKKVDDLVWCEIDCDAHLQRAIDTVWPKLSQ